MGKLCVYLPPFASDYTGACAALFDLDCLIAINDAGCCTDHFAYIDEPRWNEKVRPIFSTTLRNTDAILGTDDKVIAAISEASNGIAQQMTAVVGTPVPAIIGMDTEGIAAEIEYRTKRPAFGFNTTGFSYYDKGIIAAGRALTDRFAAEKKSPRQDSGRLRVNIVGMTPLDFGNTGNHQALVKLLAEAGIDIVCSFFMDMTVGQLEVCREADLNLAVSSAGVAISKYLKQQDGTPWIAGFPVGTQQAAGFAERLRAAAAGKPDLQNRDPGSDAAEAEQGRILIVADQVIGNSLREALRLLGDTGPIDVATFFGWHREIAQPGDLQLKNEKQYLNLLRSGKYNGLLGDPFLLDVPPVTLSQGRIRTLPIVHPAVSGKLKWEEMPVFTGQNFSDLLRSFTDGEA